MRRIAMTRHQAFVTILLLSLVALILGATARRGRGEKHHHKVAKMPFEEASLYIEFNSTAQDVGIQVALDAEAWKNLRIVSPDGQTILDLSGKGSLRKLGLSEFFFESDEPALADLPLEDLLAVFPEGEYKFFGTTPDGEKLPAGRHLEDDEKAIRRKVPVVLSDWRESLGRANHVAGSASRFYLSIISTSAVRTMSEHFYSGGDQKKHGPPVVQ